MTTEATRSAMTVAEAKEIVADPREIGRSIGWEFYDWSHQCHAASLRLVRTGLLGPDARVARGACHGVAGQHSWIVVNGDCYDPRAVVVDPTLWSYDRSVSDVWVGTADARPHRPHGFGSIWEWGRPSRGNGPNVALTPKFPLSGSAEAFLDIVGPLDVFGWATLAGAPVGGWPAAEILAAMDDTPGLSALIPIDVLGMATDRNPAGMYW